MRGSCLVALALWLEIAIGRGYTQEGYLRYRSVRVYGRQPGRRMWRLRGRGTGVMREDDQARDHRADELLLPSRAEDGRGLRFLTVLVRAASVCLLLTGCSADWESSPPAVAASESATSLHKAAESGNAREVASLLARGAAVDATDERNRTPLHDACEIGHDDVVRILLAAGDELRALELLGRLSGPD